MAIIITATVNDAIERAKSQDRYDQLGGYEGIKALFGWYEEISEDNGDQIELDIVAWCCEWSLYDSAVQALGNYQDVDDYTEAQAIHDLVAETYILELDSGKFLVMDY